MVKAQVEEGEQAQAEPPLVWWWRAVVELALDWTGLTLTTQSVPDQVEVAEVVA